MILSGSPVTRRAAARCRSSSDSRAVIPPVASVPQSTVRVASGASAAAAERELEQFAARPWGQKYLPIAAAWRRQWTQVIPFFAYPLAIRRLLYSTNAIESLHRQLRKALKTRGHFPNDEAAVKLLYLAVRNIITRWRAAPRDWKATMTQFPILYPERFTPEG